MAQLKDTIIQGSARVTDTLYTITLQAKIYQALTASDGTTYGPGSSGQIIRSNGSLSYWYTPGAAIGYGVTDSSSASAIGTGTSLTTERDVYYGLPTINYSHTYTSSTTIYAPTTGGTANTQALVGNGATTAPKWVNISPSITITAGDGSNAPKVNVTVLGQSGTAQSITKASTSVYGVTKLSSSSSSSEEGLAATPKGVWAAINTLDVSAVGGGTGEYISKISEADGKISATKSTTTVSNTWTGGTTAGPTIKTTVNGVAGTAVAIPSASASASGVVTTGDQGFAGAKTFNNNITVTGVATFNGNVAMNSSVSADSLTAGSLVVNGNTSLVNNTNTANLLPHANNTHDIGSSSLKYANIYATTFNGNATSAIKATQDSDGNAINSTYIKKSVLSGAYDIMYSSAANTPARLAANTTTTKKFLRMTGTGSAGAAPTWDTVVWGDIGSKPSSYTPSSHTHGNIQNGGTLQTNDVTIANGDKLVITDSSDSSKVARASLSFDGSTTTQALTKAGTWETFNNYSLPLASNGTRGGVQIGYTTSGTNYAVQLSSEKMYVSVPWTDTKVTSVDNHYSPSANADSELTASVTGTVGAYALNTEYTVLTGVKAQRDAKGHITGLTYTAQKIKDTNNTYSLSGLGGIGTISASGTAPLTLSASKSGTTAIITGSISDATTSAKGVVQVGTGLNVSSGTISVATTAGTSTLAWNSEVTLGTVGGLAIKAKLPTNPNTDAKVAQTSNTDNKEFPILIKNTNDTTNETAGVKYCGNITINPNKKAVTASIYKVTSNATISYNSASGCLEIVV